MGSKLNRTRPAQKETRGEKTRGDWGGSEKTPVNICNKGLFRYTGFQYTLLLVDYDTFCQHSITSDVDEECDMAVARHMSSSHADLESIINNAIEHFPHVESLRDEQKICLKNLVEGKDVFAILPTGFGKSLIFQLFPRIMSIVKETVGVSVQTIIVVTPLVAMKDQVEQLERIARKATAIGLGTKEGMDEHAAKCGRCEIVYGSPESWLSKEWRTELQSGQLGKNVVAIAIDEVHSITE